MSNTKGPEDSQKDLRRRKKDYPSGYAQDLLTMYGPRDSHGPVLDRESSARLIQVIADAMEMSSADVNEYLADYYLDNPEVIVRRATDVAAEVWEE